MVKLSYQVLLNLVKLFKSLSGGHTENSVISETYILVADITQNEENTVISQTYILVTSTTQDTDNLVNQLTLRTTSVCHEWCFVCDSSK
jgi:p-aminobenzoyl-glutamate transporter AbgT